MFKFIVWGAIFVVFVLGFVVYQDIKAKQHEELRLLLKDARYSIDKIEKNKNYYAPKKDGGLAVHKE